MFPGAAALIYVYNPTIEMYAFKQPASFGDPAMNRCEKCRFRAQYDKNPHSILGRIWKWHTGWCPGWKAYLKTLPDEARQEMVQRYR